MKTGITILCDNYIAASGLVGEHGFALMIERGEEKLLFDTGPGLSLPMNLDFLEKDLENLSAVSLSHGHYDHTGGLKWVVEQTGKVEVVAHPAVFEKHLKHNSPDSGGPPRYIGCPCSREELEALGATFRFVDQTTRIRPGLWFVTGIHRNPDRFPRDARLVRPQGDELVLDPIEDDSSILLETDEGPLLVLGCAHAGLLNILDHLRTEMGIDRLRGVLGGTHLMFYGPESLAVAIDELEKFSIPFIGVSHCTGIRAMIELSKHFGGRFVPASAGSVFEF